jgi:murein DD-endopeptidase MepM/ murein hydrolase activator NlpD
LQGHFIVGITDPAAKIIVGKKEVRVSKDGYFVFGIDRDRKFDISITKIVSGKKEIITKQVLKRKYNIQRIDGLEESKVTPPESVYKRIKEENNKIGEARAINSDLPFFKNQFIMPVEGIISGVYGSQRILNGKPKWPHYGIDIAAKQGTMIKSSGSGIVTMAEDDLYYTGGTIIMDHGHGISTIYSHLETVMVSVGDKINQGDVIGTVGSTGRSTGPHLDFRVNWFQTRLDPMSVIN